MSCLDTKRPRPGEGHVKSNEETRDCELIAPEARINGKFDTCYHRPFPWGCVRPASLSFKTHPAQVSMNWLYLLCIIDIFKYLLIIIVVLLFKNLLTFIHPMMNILDTAASPVIIDSTPQIQGIWRSSPCRWVLLFSFHIGAPKRVGHVSSCDRRTDVAERSILNIAPCLRRGWVSAVVWWFLYVFVVGVFVCYIMTHIIS